MHVRVEEAPLRTHAGAFRFERAPCLVSLRIVKSRFGMQMQAYLGEEAARGWERRRKTFFQFVASLALISKEAAKKRRRISCLLCAVFILTPAATLWN